MILIGNDDALTVGIEMLIPSKYPSSEAITAYHRVMCAPRRGSLLLSLLASATVLPQDEREIVHTSERGKQPVENARATH
jgi:hypothetical protein